MKHGKKVSHNSKAGKKSEIKRFSKSVMKGVVADGMAMGDGDRYNGDTGMGKGKIKGA